MAERDRSAVHRPEGGPFAVLVAGDRDAQKRVPGLEDVQRAAQQRQRQGPVDPGADETAERRGPVGRPVLPLHRAELAAECGLPALLL
ncbi:hypothetical protein [Streptomyces sp. NPDC051162]|uniref:hypothetical protein n=1 Tax=unclassified Streptomyces TaxID=2593676 RepID=UPI00342FFF69